MIKLSNAKSINIYRDGAWQNQKMGYVYKSGQWWPVIQYDKWIYEDGKQYQEIEHYTRDTDRYNSKIYYEENYIRFEFLLQLDVYNAIYEGFYTSEAINVTDYSTLNIEIESQSNIKNRQVINFGLSMEASAENGEFNNRVFVPDDGLSKGFHSLDVNDARGYFHFYINASEHNLNTTNGYLFIYKIWLE